MSCETLGVVCSVIFGGLALLGWGAAYNYYWRADDLESELRRTRAHLEEIRKLLPGGER